MKNIYVLMMLPVLMMAGCKKEKKQAAGCFIRGARETNMSSSTKTTRIHSFEYNDDGTVARILSASLDYSPTTEIKVFSYSGNKVFIDYYLGKTGKSSQRATMVLDDQKRISTLNVTNEAGKSFYTLAVTYDNEGQAVVMNIGPGTTKLYWADGDLVSWDKQEYFSYGDTAYNIGAIKASFDELLTYGRPILKRTKLRKTYASSPDTLYSTYQLDGDGKVLKWTEASKDARSSNTLEYTYECR